MDREPSICLPYIRTPCPVFTEQRLCFSLASLKHQGVQEITFRFVGYITFCIVIIFSCREKEHWVYRSYVARSTVACKTVERAFVVPVHSLWGISKDHVLGYKNISMTPFNLQISVKMNHPVTRLQLLVL